MLVAIHDSDRTGDRAVACYCRYPCYPLRSLRQLGSKKPHVSAEMRGAWARYKADGLLFVWGGAEK